MWIIIISYVGNYFWTHYFFNLLGAAYTFKSWRINNVPICLIFATHAYFAFYHTFSTVWLWSGSPLGVDMRQLAHSICFLDCSLFCGVCGHPMRTNVLLAGCARSRPRCSYFSWPTPQPSWKR